MVCMKSRTGRATALTDGTRALSTPRGIPTISAAALATSTRASVCIAASHWPRASMRSSPAMVSTPAASPRSHQQAIATRAANAREGGALSRWLSPCTRPPTTSLIAEKTGLPCLVRKSTTLVTQSPRGILGIGGGLLAVPGAGQIAERREQGDPRDDAGQLAVRVGDRNRERAPSASGEQVGDGRVGVDGLDVLVDEAVQVVAPFAYGLGGRFGVDGAEQLAFAGEDERRCRLGLAHDPYG